MAKVPAPTLYVVHESFAVVENGLTVTYRKGEIVHPDDPYLKTMPTNFRPFEFPHPPKGEPPVEAATAAPGEKRGR
jgi:hypothetical protein